MIQLFGCWDIKSSEQENGTHIICYSKTTFNSCDKNSIFSFDVLRQVKNNGIITINKIFIQEILKENSTSCICMHRDHVHKKATPNLSTTIKTIHSSLQTSYSMSHSSKE